MMVMVANQNTNSTNYPPLLEPSIRFDSLTNKKQNPFLMGTNINIVDTIKF